jgi:hypothetical protein
MTRAELIEAAAAAYRPRDPDGRTRALPAWHDLDEAGRVEAFAIASRLRTLEAAADPDGLSATGRSVLARIRYHRP